jgi:hypothetical protein
VTPRASESSHLEARRSRSGRSVPATPAPATGTPTGVHASRRQDRQWLRGESSAGSAVSACARPREAGRTSGVTTAHKQLTCRCASVAEREAGSIAGLSRYGCFTSCSSPDRLDGAAGASGSAEGRRTAGAAPRSCCPAAAEPVEKIAQVARDKQTSSTEPVHRRELRPVISEGAAVTDRGCSPASRGQ